MPVTISELGPSALEIRAHGKLVKDDYANLASLAERAIAEHGAVSLLVDITGLSGVSLAALWEDLKFDAKHYADVSRLAIVAEEPSSKRWLASLSKPFTKAEVAYYPESAHSAAREWVKTGMRSA